VGRQISHKKSGFSPEGSPMSNFKNKTMKKIYLLLVLLFANMSLLSCTAESLEEGINTTNEKFASEGDEGTNGSGELRP